MKIFLYSLKSNFLFLFLIFIYVGHAQSIPSFETLKDTLQATYGTSNKHFIKTTYEMSCGEYTLASSESEKVSGMKAYIEAVTLKSSSGNITIKVEGNPDSTKDITLKLPLLNSKKDTIQTLKIIVSVLKIDKKVELMLNYGENADTKVEIPYSLSSGKQIIQFSSVQKDGLVYIINGTTLKSSGKIKVLVKGSPKDFIASSVHIPIKNEEGLLIQNSEVLISTFKITCPKDPVIVEAGKKIDNPLLVQYNMNLVGDKNFFDIAPKVSDTINGLNGSVPAQKLINSGGTVKVNLLGIPITNTKVPISINKIDCKVSVLVDAELMVENPINAIKAVIRDPLKQMRSISYILKGDSINLESSNSIKVNGLTAYLDAVNLNTSIGKLNFRVEGVPEKTGIITLKLPINKKGGKEINTCEITIKVEDNNENPIIYSNLFNLTIAKDQSINADLEIGYLFKGEKFELKATSAEVNGIKVSIKSTMLSKATNKLGKFSIELSGKLIKAEKTLLSLPLKSKNDEILYIVDIVINTSDFKTVLEEKDTEFTSVTVDKNNNVWVGTKYKGLYFMDQSKKDTIFSKITINKNLDQSWIRSLAADTLGNLWVGHSGIQSSFGFFQLGGVDRININNISDQRHFKPDQDTYKLPFLENDGLGTRNTLQVIVDPYNIVRVSQGFHHILYSGIGSKYIITPGSFASISASDTNGKFIPVGTYYRQDSGISFPDNTYDPPINKQEGTRNIYSISADSLAVWIAVESFEFEKKLIPSKIMKYGFDNKLIASATIDQLTLSGQLTSVYSDGKVVWIGSNSSEGKYAMYIMSTNELKLNNDNNIIFPKSKVNPAGIWGDKYGRVFIGTTDGMIVYNGVGDLFNYNSYKHYVNLSLYQGKLPNNSQCLVDIPLISNNIKTGVVDGKDPNYVWLVTDKGVVKAHIPIAEMYAYHVQDIDVTKDPDKPFKEKVNGKTNHVFLTQLKEASAKENQNNNDESTFSVTSDGSPSTIFSIVGYKPSVFYKKHQFKLAIGDEEGNIIEGDENSDEYIKKYGKLTLKPAKFYNGNIEDLNYVDILYQHPSYIDEKDLDKGKIEKKYSLILINKDFPKEPLKTRYPIKFTLSPVLLIHGAWSDTLALDSIQTNMLDKGYTRNQILKIWKTDKNTAEISYKEMIDEIPNYIDLLKGSASKANMSVGKVNIVAYSRGGLYARGYIESLSDKTPYRFDINSLITVNTPHSGTRLANAVVDQRVISPKIKVPVVPETEFNFKKIKFKDESSLKIKDIFQMVPFMSEAESKTLWGAKNMMVAKDSLSGAYKKEETDLIEKLNSKENLAKYKEAKVPIHTFTSTFDNKQKWYENQTTFTRVPEKLFATYLLGKSVNYLGKKSKNPLPYVNILKILYDNESNDYVVPTSSMTAGLSGKYTSEFPDLMHIELPTFKIKGITKSLEIQNEIIELLKQDVRSESGSFSQNIQPKEIKYNFLSNLKLDVNNSESRLAINPKSFISNSLNLSPGDKVSFDVYQENIDQMLITIQYLGLEGIYSFSISNNNLEFKNTFTFEIPKGFSSSRGFFVTVYGYKEGYMVAKHIIFPKVYKPETLLEKIRFSKTEVKLKKGNIYKFDLLGTFADGVERRINNREDIINYKISNEKVIKKIDKENIEGIKGGEATLSAHVGMLKAQLNIIIEGLIKSPSTKVSDFHFEKIKPQDIKLVWKTTTEYRAHYFTLERSMNNENNYIIIKQQPAKGITTNDPKNYDFTDENISGHIYYRLKLYNLDNTLIYSKVIEVSELVLDCSDLNTLQINVGEKFDVLKELRYNIKGNVPISFTGYKKVLNGLIIEIGKEGRTIELIEKGIIPVTISGTPTQTGIIPIEVETKSCNITIQDKTLPQPGKLTLDCNSLNGATLEVGSSSNKTLQLKYTVIGNPINFTGYKKTEKGITIEVGTEGQQISLSGSGVIAVTISGTPTQSGSLSLEINNRSCDLSIENKQIKKNELKLVPNPLNTPVGSIYINSDFEDNHATITIFDVSGKIIYIKNYIVKKGEQKLEFKSPVLSGIYIVQFKSSKITKTLKLIVE
ncbi:T9SS type A sorting domain-containing protein [Apibacter adventoris]|uniref:T9SS type A sorting domain-containing protein n=1 Tax=Apibacter adventoris TaxID=1679466 RepID=UPI000CF60F58|nr:T9SS type A sorting domain-containing protein [Apibacter adventoris]PQL91961.1 hypothetical protein C4S76_11125 [Apibacter adventoris]